MLKIYTKKAKIPWKLEFSKALFTFTVLLVLMFNSSITYAQDAGAVEDFSCYESSAPLGTENPYFGGYVKRTNSDSYIYEPISTNGGTVSDYNPNVVGRQTVRITYEGVTREAYITLYRIPTGFNFDNVNTTVLQNGQLTGSVIVSYADADNEEVSISNMDIQNWDCTEIGTYDATVEWHNYTTTLTIDVVADPNVPNQNSNGYYEICTADELMWFNRYIRYNPYANAMLTNDIDFNENLLDEYGDLNYSNAERQWSFGSSYYGTFDGNGYIIKGFYSASNGLCWRNYGTIKNVGFVDEYIESEPDGICFENYGTISNCFTIGGSNSYNGICTSNYATVKNCYTLTPSAPLISYNDGVVTACYQNSDLSDKYVNGVTSISSEELCNGKLPAGFSENVWTPGYKKGDTYYFPKQKIFVDHQSITISEYEILIDGEQTYTIGDEIDLSNISAYALIHNLRTPKTHPITVDDIKGFSTDKAGDFTAIITIGNTQTPFPYKVIDIKYLYWWESEIMQNTNLDNLFFRVEDNNYSWSFPLSREGVELHNIDLSTPGTYPNAYITYKGIKSETHQVLVYKKVVDIDFSKINTEIYQYQRHRVKLP